MTLEAVDTATGEILADLTVEQARECINEIKTSLARTHEWVAKAYRGRAWLALGYSSWDEMCDFELGGARLALPRDDRKQVVAELRGEGLSTRAIGSVLGVGKSTVDRDLSGVPNGTPDVPAPEPTPVTGQDGKTYQPTHTPAQPRPQRHPLPGQFTTAVVDLERVCARLERLAEDDRFSQNADQVAAKHRSDLIRAAEALARVLDRMP